MREAELGRMREAMRPGTIGGGPGELPRGI
jgi:hypothetical protein